MRGSVFFRSFSVVAFNCVFALSLSLSQRMIALLDDFRDAVDSALPRLERITDVRAAQRPAPTTWSAKEVLGHLVDSAANNHSRFVIAQGRDDLSFPGYDQERWVEVQAYGTQPWPEIIALWVAYNRHLIRIVARIPAGELAKPRRQHTLARIAWRPVAEGEPVTLDYFIRDYVGHLRHHLAQIWERTSRAKDARM